MKHLFIKTLRLDTNRVPIRTIAAGLGMTASTVYNLVNNIQENPGRPNHITEEVEETLIKYNKMRYDLNDPASYEDLQDYLEEQEIFIKRDTLRHYIRRNKRLSVVLGKPQDIQRLSVQK